MAGKESARGPTSETVRANVAAVRESQNLNYTQVSERLEGTGRTISAVGVRRIESGERRVDVDDLMALAAALGVSPVTLLMPVTNDPTDDVALTGESGAVPAYAAWGWLVGELPLSYRDEGRTTAALVDALVYQRKARPGWLPIVHPGQVRKMEGTDMSIIDDRVRNASIEATLKALNEVPNGDHK